MFKKINTVFGLYKSTQKHKYFAAPKITVNHASFIYRGNVLMFYHLFYESTLKCSPMFMKITTLVLWKHTYALTFYSVMKAHNHRFKKTTFFFWKHKTYILLTYLQHQKPCFFLRALPQIPPWSLSAMVHLDQWQHPLHATYDLAHYICWTCLGKTCSGLWQQPC